MSPCEAHSVGFQVRNKMVYIGLLKAIGKLQSVMCHILQLKWTMNYACANGCVPGCVPGSLLSTHTLEPGNEANRQIQIKDSPK